MAREDETAFRHRFHMIVVNAYKAGVVFSEQRARHACLTFPRLGAKLDQGKVIARSL